MGNSTKKLKIVNKKIIFNSIYVSYEYDTLIFKNGKGLQLAVFSNGLLQFTPDCSINQQSSISAFVTNHLIDDYNGTSKMYLRFISVKRPNGNYFFNAIIAIMDLLNKFDITEYENGNLICF